LALRGRPSALFGYNGPALLMKDSPVTINVFLAIGVVGLIATFLTELAAGLLSGAFGQHPLGRWLPYYTVWLVFLALGLVMGRKPAPPEK